MSSQCSHRNVSYTYLWKESKVHSNLSDNFYRERDRRKIHRYLLTITDAFDRLDINLFTKKQFIDSNPLSTNEQKGKDLRQLIIFSVFWCRVKNVIQFAVGVIIVWFIKEVFPDELVVFRMTIAAAVYIEPVRPPCTVTEALRKRRKIKRARRDITYTVFRGLFWRLKHYRTDALPMK